MEKYEDIKREIENGNVRSAYLLLGENNYLKEGFVKIIESKFISPEFAVTDKFIVYSDDSSNVDIYGWLYTLPFGSKKKLLVFIIENVKLLSESVKKQIQAWIDKPSTTSILIIFYENKELKIFNNVTRCICWNFWENEVKRRINSFVVSRGMRIEEKAIDFLIDVFGVDMYAITTELEKLISFISPEKFIREVDVRKMGEQELTCSIYDLTHAIGNKNLVKATKALDLLFELGDVSAGGILWKVSEHLNKLLEVKEKPNETLGLSPKRLQECRNEAKKWEQEDILKGFSLLYEVDYGIKRGKAKPKFLCEEMIYKLC